MRHTCKRVRNPYLGDDFQQLGRRRERRGVVPPEPPALEHERGALADRVDLFVMIVM
jgi:hypothetical protein